MMNPSLMERQGEVSTRRARLLLIDEEARDLIDLRQIMETQGYEVSTCMTYEGGVQLLSNESFDFVVVSQGSVAFEGRKVLDRITRLERRVPVLVLTRCIDMPCYLEAMQMGALDYLEKPIAAADLVSFVRAHVRRDRFMSHGGAA
jgi:DNA-binding response OmpR family regulator